MTTLENKVCEHCGLTFEIKTKFSGGAVRRFCTSECQRKAYLSVRRDKTTNVCIACEHCGFSFEIKTKFSGIRFRRFCTSECQRKAYLSVRRVQDKKSLYRKKQHFKKYGLTLEDFQNELQNQNYVCAICFQPETSKQQGTLRRLSVDHNHTTGCYRGLLCGKCNKGIGLLQDDIAILKQAIQYLERHKDPRDNT